MKIIMYIIIILCVLSMAGKVYNDYLVKDLQKHPIYTQQEYQEYQNVMNGFDSNVRKVFG